MVEFSEKTVKDINVALENLSKDGMSAFILDLRNNPGGLLDVAVKVAERFIQNGKLIVYTKGRRPTQNLEFLSRSTHPILNLPMAVLINEGSASGSEIVAGSLQDYKRAIIVGTKSFGKGSVQTVIPLSDGSALRLTTSKYFTPSGKVIHGNGVKPDIVVEAGEVKLSKAEDLKALPPQEIFEEVEKKEKVASEEKEPDYKTDNQLIRAVDILKAIRIYKDIKN